MPQRACAAPIASVRLADQVGPSEVYDVDRDAITAAIHASISVESQRELLPSFAGSGKVPAFIPA